MTGGRTLWDMDALPPEVDQRIDEGPEERRPWMQWTGDNAAEMRAWAGVPFLEPVHGRPAAVSIQDPDGTHGWLPVQVGDVVVKSDPDQRWAYMGGDPYPTRCKPVFTVRHT